MKRHIPNLLTASNLFSGCLALIFIGTEQMWPAVFLVIAALIFDFFDGFSARLLGVSSPIGKELDSLADGVTFGVVPGFVMALLIQRSLGLNFLPDQFPVGSAFLPGTKGPWLLFGLLIPVFSALRLAKFNIDTRQTDSFYGLPTPANAMLILSIWMIVELNPDSWLAVIFSNTWVLVGLCVVSSYLLIMDVRLLALKFKSFRFRENIFRYILIGMSAAAILLFQHQGVPFVILLYISLSLLQNTLDKGRDPANFAE